MKKALITGITGQDGSYLCELLLEKGYEVHGMIRRSSSFNTGRIDHLYNDKDIYNSKLFLHYGDLTDSSNLNRLLEKTQPQEIYNLGAQSHVKVSFEVPEYTAEVDGIGTLRFLDAIKETGLQTKFYQASTSELYGKVVETPQTEKTPFYPRSPYAVAKLYGFWIIKNYREAYNIFASNGILFNHESPRRGGTFVTRKITQAASRIKYGIQESLSLGNLNSKRDWGFAPEYCEGMWRMLQQEAPDDFNSVIQETEIKNLFVVSAGVIPPNPSELLGSERMRKLVSQLEAEWDMVLFDSPPLVAVTDATMVSKEIDRIIMVVKSGGTDKGAFNRTLLALQNVEAPLGGVVMNAVTSKNSYGSYYYYYQYYHYYGDSNKS